MKNLVKQLIRGMGFDLRRLNSNSSSAFQLCRSLSVFGIDTVLDIGANKGQFATEIRSMGYRRRIVSFEPLSDVWQQLHAAASTDELWMVHPRGAIGDRDGEIDINIAGNSASSSVLPMTAAHSCAAEASAYVGSETTPIARLDSVADDYLSPGDRVFIKIDTQGFEWQVLDGAAATLARAVGALCEVSLVPLYQDQRLWLEMLARFEGAGFTLWALQPGFTDSRDGRTLQLDAVFFRTG